VCTEPDVLASDTTHKPMVPLQDMFSLGLDSPKQKGFDEVVSWKDTIQNIERVLTERIGVVVSF
jgi:hypothetical protein